MTYTLALCLGMFLGVCGMHSTSKHPTYEACVKERDAQVALKNQSLKYATCSITIKEQTK